MPLRIALPPNPSFASDGMGATTLVGAVWHEGSSSAAVVHAPPPPPVGWLAPSRSWDLPSASTESTAVKASPPFPGWYYEYDAPATPSRPSTHSRPTRPLAAPSVHVPITTHGQAAPAAPLAPAYIPPISAALPTTVQAPHTAWTSTSTGYALAPENNAHPVYASSVSNSTAGLPGQQNVAHEAAPATPRAFQMLPLPPMSSTSTVYDATRQSDDPEAASPYGEQEPGLGLLESSTDAQGWWEATTSTAVYGDQGDTSLMGGLWFPEEDFTAAPRFPSAYEPIGGVGMPQLRGNSGDDSWWHGPSMDEVFTHLEGLSDSSMASLVDDGGDESVAFGRLYPGADLDTADGSLLYHDSVCGW
ncbi:hypothetical protein FOMPIDRAFT_1050515 [Fomitopsis schrenkii]|uniref:Uncharacterized protein n=1 Tax=Fomitopsis schrenkii TaxID=2126942 RepID=S8E7Z6_FOMSC|nr:hypothetical protein FOMPIDRAFT_1050515 [Fomitopsis schrenkii]